MLVLLGSKRARWFAFWLALAIAAWRTWDLHRHWFDRLIPGLLFGCRTDVRLDALLLGCLVALLLDDDSVRNTFSQRFKSWMWWLCVGGYAATQFVYLSQESRGYSLFESAILPVVVAGTVYGPTTFITILLEAHILKWIGRLSYSLYLWQQLFSLPAVGSKFSVLQWFPLNIVMIFLCGWLSYRFIERPFISWGHRLAPPPTEGRDDLAPRQPANLKVGDKLAEAGERLS